MDTDKIDSRDLKAMGVTYNKIKKSIDTLMNSLEGTPNLAMEFKNSLINYIIGA